MKPVSPTLWLALGLLTACGGSGEPEPTKNVSNDATLSPETVTSAAAIPSGLIPSPLEVENAVRRAGVADSLLARVPDSRGYSITTDTHLDRVAVQTGVLLTDVILSARKADATTLSTRLEHIHIGLKAMGADAELLQTVEEFKNGIAGDVITREALLEEMARITDLMTPEKKWGPSPQTGPLVQAGAWLAGVHMVANSIVAADRVDAADQLLKHPDVVGYFLGYLSTKNETPSTILHVLQLRLEDIHVRTKKRSLNRDDVESILATTDGIFRQL